MFAALLLFVAWPFHQHHPTKKEQQQAAVLQWRSEQYALVNLKQLVEVEQEYPYLNQECVVAVQQDLLELLAEPVLAPGYAALYQKTQEDIEWMRMEIVREQHNNHV